MCACVCIGDGKREPEIEMTKMFSNNLFATLLLAAVVFSDVKSLPTSVLVDSKQQSDAAIGANNKGNHFIYQMADGFLESVELIDRIENQFDCI